MNFLDIRTVLFNQFVTDAVCMVVLIFLFVQNRKRFAGIFYWVLDFALQTAAALLILLRGSIPDVLSFVFSNTFVIAGSLLCFRGLLLFTGKHSPKIYNYLLLVSFIVFHLYFLFAQPDLAMRNFILSVGLLISCLQCAWLMLRRVERGMRPITFWVGLIFGGFCIVSIIRMVVILAIPNPSNDFFQSGTYDTLLLISYQLLLIFLTFCMVLMVNQRLIKENQTHEQKFTKAFHSSPYGITLTRASDGKMLDVNDGFVAITGFSGAEVIGKTTADLHLWVKEADRVAVVSNLLKGTSVRSREYQFRKKSGEMITGLFSADMIMIEDQRWILSSINDITDLKNAQQSLIHLNADLEARVEERTRSLKETQVKLMRQEKLATIGKLAGSISHELRNPIAVITNSIYYLGTKIASPDEKIKKHIKLIQDELTLASKIISDFLDFARTRPEDITRIEIPGMIRTILEKLSIPENIKVHTNFPVTMPSITADLRTMQLLFQNLIMNAFQAMPNGGSMDVTVVEKENMIEIAIKDSGIGIPSKDLPQLFEPLFSTKINGIGLGLSIAKEIVERFDGKIEVQSTVGIGSTFTVKLPVENKK